MHLLPGDDTVVMAGRIREAKLAKQADLKRRRAGATARFGEQLRMSLGASAHSQHDPIEEETVEDWVQMRIIEGYSHGFLQVSTSLRLQSAGQETLIYSILWHSA